MNSPEPVMPWNLGPEYPRWIDTLRDGSTVVVRPIGKQDADAERAFIEALSPQSRRFRFLGEVRHPSDALIEQLTNIDYSDEVAFVAVMPGKASEQFLGISRYSTSRDGTSCEFAVAVLDEWQHKGLGSALVAHLIEVARARGIPYMFSIDSAHNVEMAGLARRLGFTRRLHPDDATLVIHSRWLSPAD